MFPTMTRTARITEPKLHTVPLYGCAYPDTRIKEGSALGHKWDNGVITKEPTCSAQGERLFTCQNDNSHTKTETVPLNPNAHKWSEFVYNNDATVEADGTETIAGANTVFAVPFISSHVAT